MTEIEEGLDFVTDLTDRAILTFLNSLPQAVGTMTLDELSNTMNRCSRWVAMFKDTNFEIFHSAVNGVLTISKELNERRGQ